MLRVKLYREERFRLVNNPLKFNQYIEVNLSKTFAQKCLNQVYPIKLRNKTMETGDLLFKV